ncbi:Os02g0773450 [Oryza sativa Japonica Group]|uniref:Os02g0773450 protein n=1 Tax=Oryza sativa subsp. japonica TaxID=39947 RepID=A0A0P0VQB0_ORYSJ|nr:hypothetical protein EE612_013954 [Oryza sativa]BAS81141.1 Os02g0773450 [Oryza sativa Japonica Group]
MPFVFTSRRAVDTIRIVTLSQRSRHHQMFILWNIPTIRPPVSSNFFWHYRMWLVDLFSLWRSRRHIWCICKWNARCCSLCWWLNKQRTSMGYKCVFFVFIIPNWYAH